MNNQTLNITSLEHSADAGVMSMLEGMGQFMNGVKQLYARTVEEKEHYRQQAESNRIEPTSIVAEGKQKELIAIFNAIYELGLITCSKKDFMQRMADACGCDSIANYNKALYNIKNTYKYDEIFKNLADVAHQEILKND